ncbi:MAG: hypothetical protein ACXQT3_02855 [Methermicoccaceae archaeon]
MAWNKGQKEVLAGSPVVEELKLGSNATAAKMLPGALVARDASDEKIKENDVATTKPIGWLGYEQAHPDYKPANITTAYAAGDFAPVVAGAGTVLIGKVAKGFTAAKGDLLIPWSDGELAVATRVGGGYAIRVPFTQNASETDTSIDLPQYMVVRDCIIEVTTAVASSTIDVGLLSTESGGDADGFLDGESCASAGIVEHNMVDDTAANNTLGALLVEADIKSADGTALYYSVPKVPGHVCDGTAKSLVYQTSAHAIAGNILLVVDAPKGFAEPVAVALEAIDASSAATRGVVRSLI